MEGDSYRALVVDDEQAIREFCRTILQQIGYVVEVASDGRTALHLLDTQPTFDLLLLDVTMPQMNGVELLKQARAHGHSIPAVVMTGYNSDETAATVTELGALAVLLKPFPLDQLRTIARTVREERRSQQATAHHSTHQSLLDISQQFADQLDLPHLCTQVVETVHAAFIADQALLLGDNAEGRVTLVCQSRNHATPSAQWESLAVWVAEQQQPLILGANVQPPAELAHFQLKAQQNLACVPLGVGWRTRGALLVERFGAAFTSAECERLLAIGSLAALALEHAQRQIAADRSEGLYRALLEYAPDAVLLLDRDATTVLEVNAALTALSGYSRAEALTLAPAHLIPILHVREAQAPPDVAIAEAETVLVTHDQQRVPIAIKQSQILHKGNEYCLLLIRDISERTQRSRQSIQTEKLAGMGRLSASLAHEINNPLQALQSSLNLLVERTMPEEKRTQILQMAHGQVGQLVGVVQHMMDLYRPAVREGMRPLSAHELLETVLVTMTPRLQAQHITVERDWESQLPRVRGVTSQLKQVLSSLVLNAVESMPEGGELRIHTHSTVTHQRTYVQIVVADTGRGIAPHELPSVFEPFFSRHAERSGLSLAVSYNVVQQHEGRLAVESTAQGTAFTVTLPAW